MIPRKRKYFCRFALYFFVRIAMSYGHSKKAFTPTGGKTMAKTFERVSINPNDDGSFSISITPVRKEEKGKDGSVGISYQDDKTYTAASLEEAIGKIRGFGGDTAEMPEEPAEGEYDDMDEFMSPDRGKKEIDVEEEEEK
jgi:hypothetical protein